MNLRSTLFSDEPQTRSISNHGATYHVPMGLPQTGVQTLILHFLPLLPSGNLTPWPIEFVNLPTKDGDFP